MSFIGTQPKCKACEKTVYPVELLAADGVSHHKSRFKCSHCKGPSRSPWKIKSITSLVSSVLMADALYLHQTMRPWMLQPFNQVYIDERPTAVVPDSRAVAL